MAGAPGPASVASFSPTHYDNFTAAQCLALPPAASVDCSAQHLNVTAPPSEWTYSAYPGLWQNVFCLLYNTTYSNRVDDQDSLNYCTVPLRGYDGILFFSISLLVAAVVFGRLSSVAALCLGGALGTVNAYANLLELSNSVAIWLAIQPADLFFYAFIPPLVLEETLRLDLFLVKKTWVHIFLSAYVLVFIHVITLPPIILYVLGFKGRGWSWVHGAVFTAIIAPTDTVAVGAIMNAASGPAKLSTIIKGESVGNDASGITLFGIFSGILAANAAAGGAWPSVWSTLPGLCLDLVKLSAIGVAMGLAFSWATGRLLRWLRWRGASPPVETTAVISLSYMCYYLTSGPLAASGVLSIVTYGLYGNATSKWGMLAAAEESGAFDAVWDTVAFAVNGLVFFWSGAASVNFLIRSAGSLNPGGAAFAAIPVIWAAMIVVRTLGLAAFNLIFKALGQPLSPADIAFSGWASMRGAVSLIMASVFAVGNPASGTGADGGDPTAAQAINAEILLWTASFVVLTLTINGPLCGPMLRLLRLCKVPRERYRSRARAMRSLRGFTAGKLAELKAARESEFLAGANWDLVEQYCEVTAELEGFDEVFLKADGDGSGSGASAAAAAAAVQNPSPRLTSLEVLKALCFGAATAIWKLLRRIWCCSPGGSGLLALPPARPPPDASGPSSGSCRPSPTAVVVHATPVTPDQPAAASFTPVTDDSGLPPPPPPVRVPSPARRSYRQVISDAHSAEWAAADTTDCPFLPSTREEDDEVGTTGAEAPLSQLSPDVETGQALPRGRSSLTIAPEPFVSRIRHSSASMSSIQEGTGGTDGDGEQRTVRGAYGAALLQGLQKALDEGERGREGENTAATMPAAVGRRAGAQLRTHLAAARASRVSERLTTADGTEISTFDIERDTSGSQESAVAVPEQGAATVSGASGRRLAAELRRQLSWKGAPSQSTQTTASTSLEPPLLPLYRESAARDLLGRKPSVSGSPRVQWLAGLGLPFYSPSPTAYVGPPAATASPSATPTAPPVLRRDSATWAGRDRAVLPGSAPVAAALLDQRLAALQHRQDAESIINNDEEAPALPATKLAHPSILLPSAPTAAALQEEKSRVVSGLKRRFAERRLAGLLSSRALRLLDYACDAALEGPAPSLRLWPTLEAEVRGGWAARGASRASLAALHARRALPRVLRPVLGWPLARAGAALRRYVGGRMLVACEVAVELCLALAVAPQVRWLRREVAAAAASGGVGAAAAWRPLLEDVDADASDAHRFVIQREIEAPDMFQAIQSYRAAMAVLRQQLAFIQTDLFAAGALDATEAAGLRGPVDEKIRHLELVGPVWRPPRAKAVLRSLPALEALPEAAFRRVYAAGSIIGFRKGQTIFDSCNSNVIAAKEATTKPTTTAAAATADPGLFIVLSGVVRRVLTDERRDLHKEYFQGPGGVVGELLALAGCPARGLADAAVAEGNALGRGPVLFHLPAAALRALLKAPDTQGLEDGILRLAAAFAVEHVEFIGGGGSGGGGGDGGGEGGEKPSSSRRQSQASVDGAVKDGFETLKMGSGLLESNGGSDGSSASLAAAEGEEARVRSMLAGSQVTKLHPGQPFELPVGAGAVVVGGSLLPLGSGGWRGGGGRAITAPALLSSRGAEGGTWRAGENGAVLVIPRASDAAERKEK